jgi:hypothetical protein
VKHESLHLFLLSPHGAPNRGKRATARALYNFSSQSVRGRPSCFHDSLLGSSSVGSKLPPQAGGAPRRIVLPATAHRAALDGRPGGALHRRPRRAFEPLAGAGRRGHSGGVHSLRDHRFSSRARELCLPASELLFSPRELSLQTRQLALHAHGLALHTRELALRARALASNLRKFSLPAPGFALPAREGARKTRKGGGRPASGKAEIPSSAAASRGQDRSPRGASDPPGAYFSILISSTSKTSMPCGLSGFPS